MSGGSEESLRPWSTPLVRLTLEYAVGDRPPHPDVVQSQLWKQRADDLVFWANRRPDVAARTIACTLFSEVPVTPPQPMASGTATSSTTAPPPPRLPGKLHAMCEHALSVGTPGPAAGRVAGAALPTSAVDEVTQGEVAFMATLVQRCTRAPETAGLPDYRAALARALGGAGEAAGGVVGELLCRARAAAAAGASLTRPVPGGSPTLPGLVNADEAELLRLPPTYPSLIAAAADSSVSGGGGGHSPPPAAPFAVRTREEATRRARAAAVALRQTTLVRAEGSATIARPLWAERAEAAARRPDTAATTPSAAPVDADDGQTAAVAEAGAEVVAVDTETPARDEAPAPGPARPVTTMIEEGDLVFQSGRFVVVAPSSGRRGLKGRAAEAPAPSALPAAPEVATTTSTPAPAPAEGIDAGPSPPARRKRNRSRERPPVTAKGRQRSRTDGGRLSEKPLAAAVVPIHGAPLLSPGELARMVRGLAISRTLREAFLIGLEGAAATPPPPPPPPLSAPQATAKPHAGDAQPSSTPLAGDEESGRIAWSSELLGPCSTDSSISE